MADLLKNRLLPSLLDRLADENPGNSIETFAQQVMSEGDFVKALRRDLQWLFNAVALESAENLDRFDFFDEHRTPRNYLKESVLNFGIQNFSGLTASTVRTADLEVRMRLAIARFEPRIVPASLKIEARASGEFNANALSFDIRGDVWMQPSPLPQHWKTDLDLETGAVQVEKSDRSR